jgi:hypothetical protein
MTVAPQDSEPTFWVVKWKSTRPAGDCVYQVRVTWNWQVVEVLAPCGSSPGT